MEERMLLNHLLAEPVPPHMTEEKRIHITAHTDVVLEIHASEKIDCH